MTTAEARGTAALAERELRRVVSLWTQTIAPPVLTAFIFLAVFGGALAARIRHIEGVPYLDFILPGLLVMTVASQAFANNSTSVFQARNEGYIEDVLTSPLRPWQLVLAYSSGGLLRAWLAAGIVVAAVAPFTDRGISNSATLAVTLVLTGLVFASVGVITGLWADTFDRHAFVANLVITPLALVGGVFYSARSLGEPWRTLTRFDPLYYLVDAARAGSAGFHESAVWISLVVASLTAAAAFAAAVLLVAQGWRLKP